jgi:ADP-ribosylglycohydrolase
MLGAIAGDIAGSVWEGHSYIPEDFPLFCEYSHFTDDTVLTAATADVLLHNPHPTREMFALAYKDYWHRYPHRGYGGTFKKWANEPELRVLQLHNYYAGSSGGSYGNGSAMRVSPVGWYAESLEETLKLAEDTAWYSHNAEEGLKGAKAVASCIFLARKRTEKKEIARYVTDTFSYDLQAEASDLYSKYRRSSCMASVPLAIRAFLITNTVEDAIRYAISLTGDADTLACMAGSMQEAFTGKMLDETKNATYERLTPEIVEIVNEFRQHYVI